MILVLAEQMVLGDEILVIGGGALRKGKADVILIG